LKRNIIPETADMDGEIRSRDQNKLDRYTQRFRDVFDGVAARYPEATVSLEIENTYYSFNVDASHPTVVMISRALAEAGLEPQLEGSGGGSDANVFFERGIAALPVGIGVRAFHTREESVVLSEVMQGAEVCQRILRGR
jgi:tripeptide aminopeptidase